MKVKVQKHPKIAGHIWTIRYERGLVQRHGKYGLVDAGTLTILIEPDIPDSLKSHTLVHEYVHVISDQFIGADSMREDAVCQFATGVWVFLSDLNIELDWGEIK